MQFNLKEGVNVLKSLFAAWRRLRARYPLDPLEKSRLHQRILLALTCAGLLCAALCLGVVTLCYGSLYFVRDRLLSYFQFPMLAFLNLLPVVLLVFFLYFLTNRPWLAFLLTSVLLLTGVIANYYKVVFRDDYMVFEDITLLGAAAGIAGEYDIRLELFEKGIWACALGTVFLFFVCRGQLPKWRWRLGGAAVLIAASIGSYALWYSDDELYKSFENFDYFNQWQPPEKSASYGFVYTFIHSIEDMRQPPPEGYSAEAAEALFAQYPEADLTGDVDVIACMLESFSDFSIYDSIDFTADPYEPLRQIWDESVKGTLIVDTMGGGTVNSERSFLTGYTYPHTSYRHPTESYVWYFREQGYQVEGAHPGHDWYYNRQNINQNLGFETYHFMENYFQQFTDDEYAMDDVFFPGIRDLYENRDPEKPYFAFHVSYQGHSPYSSTELVREETYVSQDGLSDGCWYTVNNYLSGVADTAAHIADFTDSFRDSERPVVLVFFGDHKPTLGAGNSYYDELGVNVERSTDEGFRNYYSTPYWIWMNDAARETLGVDPAGTGPDISPCYLMAEVFNVCGWQGPSYLNFQMEAMETLPVIQSTGRYLENGVLTAEISENAQKVLENLQIMQYDLRRTRYQ